MDSPTILTAPTPRSLDRFWSKVDIRGWDECWPWTASTNPDGYGKFSVGRKSDGTTLAHRMAYQLLVGPIPEGLELDHVRDWGCVSTLCCNPLHLEPVTHEENNRRSNSRTAVNARRTHCVNGHEFTPENTYYYERGGRHHRTCRTCRRDGMRRARTKTYGD